MNGYAKPQPGSSRQPASGKMAGRHLPAEKIDAPCHELRLLARQGLWQLFTFVAASALFFHFRHADLLAPLAENIRQLLGCPPPAALTTLALAGYSISAAILLLSRTVNGVRPSLKWAYLGYRLVFYLFYGFSHSLAEHFMSVFVAGLVLFGLEQMNIVTHTLKTQPRKAALLEKL
jgi:hypothetical protein